MMSMTADVIDIDELNSGKRREGIFGAIYWWMVKVGFAIAGALSGLIIAFVGFNPDLTTTEQQSAVDGLLAFFCFFPMTGTIIAMMVMRNYDVTEERANEIRALLQSRKERKAGGTGSYHGTEKLLTLGVSEVEIDTTTDLDFEGKSEALIRGMFEESLKTGIHGMCFSPYSEGQDIGDLLSEEQITRRMEIVKPYTRWVRSFSCTDGNQFIPVAAHKAGLKVMAGAWIGKDLAENEREIKGLIALAKEGYVDMAAVGNEVLLRGDLSEAEVLEYVHRVRAALPGIPVGYVDAYFQFVERPKLVDACDVILANCYPFWEGCPVDEAATYLKQMYAITRRVSQGKPVIITETGWPSEGSSTKRAVPTKLNAIKYCLNINSWSQKNNVELFYFSSFDESWKLHHEGDVGARWGLWNKNEELKYS